MTPRLARRLWWWLVTNDPELSTARVDALCEDPEP